jgi:hypothetical protein
MVSRAGYGCIVVLSAGVLRFYLSVPTTEDAPAPFTWALSVLARVWLRLPGLLRQSNVSGSGSVSVLTLSWGCISKEVDLHRWGATVHGHHPTRASTRSPYQFSYF